MPDIEEGGLTGLLREIARQGTSKKKEGYAYYEGGS